MKSNNPLISIIIPVYNVEKYVDKTIISVINQIYKNYELIIVDDGSPDKSIDVIEGILVNSDCNYNIFHKENGGLSDARNFGVNKANGEWIYFLDSDDVIQPDTLEYMIKAINETEKKINIVSSSFQRVILGDEFKKCSYDKGIVYLSKNEMQFNFLLRKNRILAPGALINMNWYKHNNFIFTKIAYSEDQLFLWNMFQYIDEGIAYIQKPLYNYLHRESSIMTSTPFEKILPSYNYFKEFQKEFNNNDNNKIVKRYLLSRWVLGLMHSSAKLCNKKDYFILIKECETKKHCLNLLSFPQFTVKLMALSFLISKSMFYYFMRRI